MKAEKLLIEIPRAPTPASLAYYETRFKLSTRAMSQAERDAVTRALADRRAYFASVEFKAKELRS